MAVANPAFVAAAIEQRRDLLERPPRTAHQMFGARVVEKARIAFGEAQAVAVEDQAEAGGAPRRRPAFRVLVKARDHVGEILHGEAVEATGGGQPGEQRVLLEPLHFHEPVERGTLAAQREAAGSVADDGDNPPIQVGRGAPVDFDLGLAESPPSLGRGVIEIGEANGALELVSRLAGQEDDRSVRLQAFDIADVRTVGIRPGQKSDHLALVFDDQRKSPSR